MMVDRAILREVGLRDGLQLVKSDLPTERKLEWIRDAVDAGVRQIEVTSFVPPSTFPIFADASAVAAAALDISQLEASALAVNLRGARDAFKAGLTRVSYVVSASEAHSRANARRSTDDAVREFQAIVAERRALGLTDSVILSCGIATAFGCTLQGEVQVDRVLELADRLVSMGASEIMLADTVGYATPTQVEQFFGALRERLPAIEVAAHFHDTRGLGLANIAAAARVGVRRFDASLGGLGGCPYAPGATGNVNFEDAAFMLEAMDVSTGIELERLLLLRRKIENWLPGERFTGAIARAGLPQQAEPAKETGA
jgi:hydroxymethylglutaryl-CoA lyase